MKTDPRKRNGGEIEREREIERARKKQKINVQISKKCTIKICFVEICSIVICKCCWKLKPSKSHEFLSFFFWVCIVCIHHSIYTQIHIRTHFSIHRIIRHFTPHTNFLSLPYSLTHTHMCEAARIKSCLIFIFKFQWWTCSPRIIQHTIFAQW